MSLSADLECRNPIEADFAAAGESIFLLDLQLKIPVDGTRDTEIKKKSKRA